MTSQSEKDNVYDLVIIGAGCVGIAAAYYAIKDKKSLNKICLIDKGKIGKENYWTSRFGARQNRVQYSQDYLTRFAIQSNIQWEDLEKDFNAEYPGKKNQFKYKEGSLWLGKKNISNSQGNIKAANANLTLINSSNENKVRVQSLYMQKIMQGHPKQMKVFRPIDSNKQQWDSWSALYQPDGGSIDMKLSFNRFLEYVKSKKDIVDIQDQTTLLEHKVKDSIHIFSGIFQGKKKQQKIEIKGKKVLITMGVWTPSFLKQVMGSPDLKDNQQTEYSIQEYVTSYFKINKTQQKDNIYSGLPSFYNFLNRIATLDDKETEESGYGFAYHGWDLPSKKESKQKFIHIGTSSKIKLSQDKLNNPKLGQIGQNDPRIQAAKKFVKNRMNGLQPNEQSEHWAFPIIYYAGRETILDYLYRNRKTIVVQSGGWVDHLYPLLAKTSVQLLLHAQQPVKFEKNQSVIEHFITRTRFPITSRVKRLLRQNTVTNKASFDTAIVGAGCSGLYSAYRLNKERKSKNNTIAIFDLGHLISGRLKSFKFEGTTTPMELGGMRYIPTTHILLNQMINELGIPSIDFKMNGDPIQNNSRKAYLRNDYYRMDEWGTTQDFKSNLHTAYKIEGSIVGMNSFQIISFSAFMILTAPQNLSIVNEIFLTKTDDEIDSQKLKRIQLGQIPHIQKSWYRNWKNYLYQDSSNDKTYNVELELKQWNYLKPILLYRCQKISEKDVYNGQQFLQIDSLDPLYKFGFQNVLEAQFGHEAYAFVADENGYYSNTSNASYLEQVTAYLLDFGNVTYRTLASGFDQINYAMANVLLDEQLGLDSKGEGIFLNHKLVDIKCFEDGYVLYFHINNSTNPQEIKSFYKCNLNTQNKVHCQQCDIRDNLGVVTAIPNTSITQIMVKAKNIILAMPKKSITNLTSDIKVLRKPIDNYSGIYDNQMKELYRTFYFQKLNYYLDEAKKCPDPTPQNLDCLKKLLNLQQLHIKDPEHHNDLNPQQKIDLQNLSHLVFIKSLSQLDPKDKELNQKKEKCFNDDLPIQPKTLQDLANTAQLMPAMKMLMNFDRSWWDPNFRLNEKYKQTFKNTSLINSSLQMRGVSVTDLPIRQTLYFSSGEDHLLLGSYNDMITTEYWTVLHNNFKKVWTPKHLQNHSSVIRYDPNLEIHHAKKVFVKELLKQLSLTHQIDVKQEYLKECVYQFWGNDPFGAGFHNFYSGYSVPAVMKTLRQPWKETSIHIVGQAYSNETGWVQGAFQTSELLLQQIFGLPQYVEGYYAGY